MIRGCEEWLLRAFLQCGGRFLSIEAIQLEVWIAYDPGAAWMSGFYGHDVLL